MSKVATWIKSFFERSEKKPKKPKREYKPRKKRVIVNKDKVKIIEKLIPLYSRHIICEYHGISRYLYYTIKNGKHKFSTKGYYHGKKRK